MTIWSAAQAFDIDLKVFDKELAGLKEKEKVLNKAAIIEAVSEANLLILDECQVSMSNSYVLLNEKSIKCRHKFFFSATPDRGTGEDILVEAFSGPVIYEISASELIRKGYLVPPHIFFLEVPQKKNIGSSYQDIYKKYVINNTERNNIIYKATEKLIKAGRRPIVLFSNISHGQILFQMFEDKFKVEILDGSSSTEERDEVIQKFKNKEIDMILGSKIFDVGVDIPELDAIVLAGGGTKSKILTKQRIGRVLRIFPSKTNAIVVDFYDQAKNLKKHSQIRRDIYKEEEEFLIKKNFK